MEDKIFGRPSQGRTERLQFTATPELKEWLDSLAGKGESLSEVVFLLLKRDEDSYVSFQQIAVETNESIKDVMIRLALAELGRLNRSKGIQARFDVYQTSHVGDKIYYSRIAQAVEANGANGARQYVCDTQWQSLTSLEAFPEAERPQRFSVFRNAPPSESEERD